MEHFMTLLETILNANELTTISIDELENAYQEAITESPENEEYLLKIKNNIIANAASLKAK